MVPFIASMAQERLGQLRVWDERASRVLAGRLAPAYAALVRLDEPGLRFAEDVADALQRFAERRPCGVPLYEPGPLPPSSGPR
jgi:hypothetical protein